TMRVGQKKCGRCRTYYVHNVHDNKEDAAALLGEIDARVLRLIEYLEDRYSNRYWPADPAKGGRIDVVTGSELFDVSDPLGRGGSNWREYLQDRISQLTERYSNGRMYELSPHNIQ